MCLLTLCFNRQLLGIGTHEPFNSAGTEIVGEKILLQFPVLIKEERERLAFQLAESNLGSVLLSIDQGGLLELACPL